MIIKPIKTEKIDGKQDFFRILDRFIKSPKENSILAITSKIIAICEGRTVKVGSIEKDELIEKEADFIFSQKNKYNVVVTVKGNALIASGGIDESNSNGSYVLWPKDPQKSANEVRKYLLKKYGLKNFGVIITDSRNNPLRRGTTGVAIAHSGFLALKNYIGKKDIFDRKMKVTKSNLLDALATAAVLVMGEGSEQTPMATITDIPFIKFQKRNPSKKELKDFYLDPKDDIYPLTKMFVKNKKT